MRSLITCAQASRAANYRSHHGQPTTPCSHHGQQTTPCTTPRTADHTMYHITVSRPPRVSHHGQPTTLSLAPGTADHPHPTPRTADHPVPHTMDNRPLLCLTSRTTDHSVSHTTDNRPLRCLTPRTVDHPVSHATDGRPFRASHYEQPITPCTTSRSATPPVYHTTDSRPPRVNNTDSRPPRVHTTDGQPTTSCSHHRQPTTPYFQGYGFNLHAERGKAGQYIGKVDDGSPSEAAGLKEGDRIVEVNGTNIGNENHQQVVGRIKAYSDEVNLLVVDAETDKHYKDEKIVVRGDLPEVLQLTSAQPRPSDEPAFHPDEVEVNNAHESDKEEEAVVASFHVQDRSDSDNHSHSSGEVEVQEHTREEEVDTQTREPEPEHEPEVEQNTRDEDEDDDEAIHISSLPPPDTNNIEDNEIEESPPYNPRMCHLRKWPDFSGYGFNLHADKEHGQFIGSIDPDSRQRLVV
ncbi:hypothetical protein ScPMuIL_016577 [Solemya velum]